jgi:UDP-3-O-[3-hydroxymyristoyl] glucosamine N-acyltransferase
MLSDVFDCAIANGLTLGKVIIHLPEVAGDRDRKLADRLVALEGLCRPPMVQMLDDFVPAVDHELYLLGPTTPSRSVLAAEVKRRFNLGFHTMVHPSAYVSPLAKLSQGVFIGAKSVIGSGADLNEHVFINRGVTIGHDTRIGAFSRIQAGSDIGGLSCIGFGVTVSIGATLIERLVVGNNAVIAGGAVVISDVGANTLVAGVPAVFKKLLG